MSKSLSHLFYQTTGFILFHEKENADFVLSSNDAESIIAERTKDLDVSEHRIKNKKILSSKQMTIIRKKIKNRTATMKEYKNYSMTLRLNKRRQRAISNFWKEEKQRILSGKPWTRAWTEDQKNAILHDEKPKLYGKTMQGHHTYSVSKYPHLSDKSEIIYPVTFQEHLYEWHGGNFRNSTSGKRIIKKENK